MNRSERRRYQNKLRRQRQLRRNILLTILLCLSVMTCCIYFGFLSQAGERDREVSYKYFTSITVMPGDTLYSIADAYTDSHYESADAYIAEVCRTNHIENDEIRAGEYLIVPYYSADFR